MLLRKAIELKPKDPYLHVGLAMAFAQAGQLDKALPAFKRAIYLKPPNVHQIHYNLAYTYQNMGRYRDAMREFNKVRTQLAAVDCANAATKCACGCVHRPVAKLLVAPWRVPRACHWTASTHS